MAAKRGDVEALQSLLKSGANINQQDFQGYTPLMDAIDWGEGYVNLFSNIIL